ncbi:MAG: hypothetical protein K6F79_01625 [Saccharofermentans sp.]|nr:hypothetical protein [Saccharofermentans sp.]
MNKELPTSIKKIIIVIVALLFAFFIWLLESGYDKLHSAIPLFVIDSPINDYSVEVDYLYRDSAGYGEYDRITLIDGNGNHNAIWIMFVPNEMLYRNDKYGLGVKHASEESFLMDWKSDGLIFNIRDANYAFGIEYDDVLNRNVHDSQITRILVWVVEAITIIVLILLGLLLFYAKHMKVLVSIIIVSMIILISTLVLGIGRLKSIDSVISMSHNASECGNVRICNSNGTFFSDCLDRVYVDIYRNPSVSEGPVSFSMFINGSAEEMKVIVDFYDNSAQMAITGEDNLTFTVFFNS